MCGRYFLTASGQLLAQLYSAIPSEDAFSFDQEIYPAQEAPVVIQPVPEAGQTERRLGLMKWGFNPPYADRLIINARAETIDQKPTFKEPFQLRRCLVPVSSFFEWSGQKGNKTKHEIKVTDRDIFSLAGLYAKFKDEAGEENWAYTIITTEPNSDIKPIHGRMPAILQPEESEKWLDPTAQSDHLKSLLKPYPSQLKIRAT
ncbi:MAG: SOS response-associated peptidase [Bacillota bacterium]